MVPGAGATVLAFSLAAMVPFRLLAPTTPTARQRRFERLGLGDGTKFRACRDLIFGSLPNAAPKCAELDR
jgi:hypothetical protein